MKVLRALCSRTESDSYETIKSLEFEEGSNPEELVAKLRVTKSQ